MRTVNYYILGNNREARQLLESVRLADLTGGRVQRGGLILLWACLQLVTRVRRIVPLANLFFSRWHLPPGNNAWRWYLGGGWAGKGTVSL